MKPLGNVCQVLTSTLMQAEGYSSNVAQSEGYVSFINWKRKIGSAKRQWQLPNSEPQHLRSSGSQTGCSPDRQQDRAAFTVSERVW